jgi:hypothetical protein
LIPSSHFLLGCQLTLIRPSYFQFLLLKFRFHLCFFILFVDPGPFFVAQIVARLAGVIPIQLTYFWGDTLPGWEPIWGPLVVLLCGRSDVRGRFQSPKRS